MRVCGIVAEYNPFHNGHQYHLEETRKKLKADIIIVVMSGNFLQRGEPAIVDKWSRARAALMNGADIVVELPTDFSVQPADFFAEGAVSVLNGLGCDLISFGSESGNSQAFREAADLYLENEAELDDLFRQAHQQKQTYAQNFSDVINTYFSQFPLDLTQPNNMLGFAYAKEIRRNGYDMSIQTVPRKNSHYNDNELDSSFSIASATAIRRTLLEKRDAFTAVETFVPAEMYDVLKNHPLISWENLFRLLDYRISVMSIKELSQIYLMEKGLEYRLKEKISDAVSMKEFIESVKTRQLTWVSLQRICCHILLNNTKQAINMAEKRIEAVRLLGFTEAGRGYIGKHKNEWSIKLVSNLNKRTAPNFEQDIKAGHIYRLADKEQINHQDFYTKPINFIDNNGLN